MQRCGEFTPRWRSSLGRLPAGTPDTWLDDYDPETIDEVPLKIALGRIAAKRNAARTRLAKKD